MPSRFTLGITDARDNAFVLDQIYARLKDLSPSMRLVVTVSPVPLGETFSGRDAMIANTYSKCTLRCAAEVFSQAHADVDYFPSYEIVTQSKP